MKVGSEKGRKKIYTKKGAPKLEGGEKVFKKYHEKCSVNHRKKGKKSWSEMLEKGKGNIYLTNRRFIYIRPPIAWYRKKTSGLGRISYLFLFLDTAANYDESKEMKKKNIFEFIEFKYTEDIELEYGRMGRGRIIVNTKSGDYTIFTKKYILEGLEKILNKIK
jgi:hypothetical protein